MTARGGADAEGRRRCAPAKVCGVEVAPSGRGVENGLHRMIHTHPDPATEMGRRPKVFAT